MPFKVALFDFHFTLARCDCQLDVETRNLPSRLVEKLVGKGFASSTYARQLDEQAKRRYHEIRAEMYLGKGSWNLVDRAQTLLDYLGYQIVEQQLYEWIYEIMHECLSEVSLVRGADIALRKLKEAGYRLGVVSTTGYAPSVEEGLEMLGLRGYFDEIITSGNERVPKSDPEIYRRAVSKFAVEPEEAIHTGDQVIADILSAKAAGLSAVWFTGLGRESAAYFGLNWDQEKAAGEIADAVAGNMYDIPSIISYLEKRASI